VSFANREVWWFFSEPRRGDDPLDAEKLEAEVHVRIRRDGATALTTPALNDLRGAMIAIIERHRHHRVEQLDFSQLLAAPEPFRQIAYLSRTFFGAECLVVSATEQTSR
jgi:hypothetical protein